MVFLFVAKSQSQSKLKGWRENEPKNQHRYITKSPLKKIFAAIQETFCYYLVARCIKKLLLRNRTNQVCL